MCILAWKWQPSSDMPLVLIGNRDEFYNRPALPVHWWSDYKILAGRDLLAGGTWLGINKSGKFAALTNFRDDSKNLKYSLSRGDLVKNFLVSSQSNIDYLSDLINYCDSYNPFNLLVYDGESLFGFESTKKEILSIAPGYGVVSNGSFNCNWPKSIKLKTLLEKSISTNFDLFKCHTVLENTDGFNVDTLPSTGLPIEMEKLLSTIHINSPLYGTRAGSCIFIEKDRFVFSEKSYNKYGFSEFVLNNHLF